MNFILKNWKTTLMGFIAFVPQILNVFGNVMPTEVATFITAAAAFVGFLFAKDGNKTGV